MGNVSVGSDSVGLGETVLHARACRNFETDMVVEGQGCIYDVCKHFGAHGPVGAEASGHELPNISRNLDVSVHQLGASASLIPPPPGRSAPAPSVFPSSVSFPPPAHVARGYLSPGGSAPGPFSGVNPCARPVSSVLPCFSTFKYAPSM